MFNNKKGRLVPRFGRIYVYMYVDATMVIATVHRHSAIYYKSTDLYIFIPD